MTKHPGFSRWVQALLLVSLALSLATLTWPSLRPVHAAGDEESATNVTVTLTPVADSTLSQIEPDTNHGTADVVRAARVMVPNAPAPVVFAGLLRFDLSSIPTGAIITHAELRLYQNSPAAEPWQIGIGQILPSLQPWDEKTVTWNSEPPFVPVYTALAVPAGGDQRVSFDVTTLIRDWVHLPNPQPEHSLRLTPGDTIGARNFASSESAEPPQLVVEYTPLPALVTVPQATFTPEVNGICDAREYTGAALYPYADVDDSVHPVYLMHTADDLYVCIEGVGFRNQLPGRFFGLYLDTDRSGDEDGNQVPNDDDFSLQITVLDPVSRTLQGTGNMGSPYAPDEPDDRNDFGPWEAVSFVSFETGIEAAEFRIPFTTLTAATPSCGAPIGLGIYHQSVRDQGNDAGWPLLSGDHGPTRPDSWIPLQLINPNCPIRVCVADAVNCDPAGVGALVYRAADGQAFSVDEAGFVQDRPAIAAGDQLWALYHLETHDRFTVYLTSGAPQTVDSAAFQGTPPGVMTLVVSDTYPLVLHDLAVSTQWTLSPDERDHLEQQVVKASDFLYDFTDGQFALGDVTVHQNYEAWDEADLWTYANNNMRPKATAGGVVEAETPDPDNDLSYFPGYVHMGRYWNRFHAPEGQPIVFEGQPVDPSALVDDWSIVLGHEMGHYALFLFDTYFGIGPDEKVVSVYTCTGSAMGWVYDAENWGFVHDPGHWDAGCADTHANQLLSRDEWATIRLHYPWLNTPTAFVPGPAQPPIPLTQVTFIEPANPGTPLTNQVYDLLYENGENASRKALAFLLRGDLVIGQGNVPKATTQIELVGAQAGDRFCVYDIDARPPTPDSPRHQYGCEILDEGDNQLDLERDTSWRPIVLVDPTGPFSITVSVIQPGLSNATVKAVVYPEHTPGASTVPLAGQGRVYTGSVDLGKSTPSAYIQVFVDEPESETNPRREAMAMYGIDGGTVPGPSSWDQKAPVYSSDGNAMAWPIESVRVEPGEWVSMQYMVETFDPPSGSTRLSDAYRVISWPPEIAERIVVSVIVPPPGGGFAAESLAPQAVQQGDSIFIRYWTGGDWRVVPTNVVTGEDGNLVASAALPAGVVFAVFNGPAQTYLPAAFE